MAERVPTKIEESIGYTFRNEKLLEEALTHSSYRNENKEVGMDNERLEFLGDALIDSVISLLLYEQFPEATEGVLTRLRSNLVSESALFARGQEISLGESLHLGRGEELSGGKDRPSIVSSAYEALMAAVYLDGGEDALKDVLSKSMAQSFSLLSEPDRTDFKTRVQELVQARRHCTPSYRLDREEGPDHEKQFYVSLIVMGRAMSSGVGKSKKEASQRAAKALLDGLEENPALID